jgi:hypothetical protein
VAQERLSVRQIKDLLRLHLVGGVTSCRELGRGVGCSKTAVSDCLRRAAVAGLKAWEAIAELDESELERRFYPSAREGGAPPRTVQRPVPDWTKVREELAGRDHQVTLALLWQEYKAEHPEGYQDSQFAELYRRFEKKLSVVLRQAHRGGEKTFVDFCNGISLIDPSIGEIIPMQLFVGTARGDVVQARAQGTYERLLKRFAKIAVLVIDDFGLPSMSDREKQDLLEAIEERYGTGATVVTAQLPTSDWRDYLGGGRVADAI